MAKVIEYTPSMLQGNLLIDTHTHIYDEAFEADGGGTAAVDRALEAGVGHMIMPNVDASTVAPLLDLAERRRDVMSVALGLHPTEVRDDWREVLASIMEAADNCRARLVAVGEVGVDLYWDKALRKLQIEAFEAQLDEAARRNLPVIIHCREALDEVVTALSHHPGVRGVMHSFGGSAEDVERVRRVADMHFGLNGIATFKNCRVTDAVPAIGLDRLLLETDAPYLAPVPKRGRRCESAYLPYTALHIADSLAMPLPELARATTDNARRLFGLDSIVL